MMKSEVKQHSPDNKPKYPRLMISKDLDYIVMFHKTGYGMVVHGKENSYKLGEIVDCWEMSCFEDFHGSVTLTQD